MAKTVEEYRRQAAAADLARRRDQARLPYDEKLVIVQRLRRAAATLRGAEPGSGTLIASLLPDGEKGNSPSPVPGEGRGEGCAEECQRG